MLVIWGQVAAGNHAGSWAFVAEMRASRLDDASPEDARKLREAMTAYQAVKVRDASNRCVFYSGPEVGERR